MRALRLGVVDRLHLLRMRQLERGSSPAYRLYLHSQLERTLSKRSSDPGVGARLLITRVLEAAGNRTEAAVLCIGCRNGIELDEFRRRGATNVTGIDLFSQRCDILVMDMHHLRFPDDSFDIVYASHALEHAYDLDQALTEIQRVARPGAVIGIEVPLRHKGSDADLIELTSLDEVRGSIASITDRILWADEQPARTPTNDQGSAVARIVLTTTKRPSSSAARP